VGYSVEVCPWVPSSPPPSSGQSPPMSASGVDDPLGGYLDHMSALLLALAIVAAVIAVIELVRSRMTMLIAWAVLALALIPIIPAIAAAG
jgi:hypothetical protein